MVRASALSLLGLTWSLLMPTVAMASAVVSSARITQPDQVTPLNSGSSSTLYGVLLPQGARCPGDSAHKGYRVDSYLVPKGVSPTSVSFKTGVPSRWFGYIANGAYYGAINTAESTGQIVNIPSDFTWSRLTPQDLFSNGARTAVWEGGIACSDTNGVVTNYWNTEVIFAASRTDPGGFTWALVQPDPVSDGHGPWLAVGLFLAALVLGGVSVGLVRSRPREEQNVRR